MAKGKESLWNLLCVLYDLSHIQLFAAPWTIDHQVLCPWNVSGKNAGVGVLSFSRGSSQPRDWTHNFGFSCSGKQIFLPMHHLGNLQSLLHYSTNPIHKGSTLRANHYSTAPPPCQYHHIGYHNFNLWIWGKLKHSDHSRMPIQRRSDWEEMGITHEPCTYN